MNTFFKQNQHLLTELSTSQRLESHDIKSQSFLSQDLDSHPVIKGNELEDCHVAPFDQSCINHNAIQELSDYSGIWPDKLIVSQARIKGPFDYNASDLENFQSRYDYFSKQTLANSSSNFFSNYNARYLRLRSILYAVEVGCNHENPFRNTYGWYVSDAPVTIKLRMTLVDPLSRLAIATFFHTNTGPQSLRQMDKSRGFDEAMHLLTNSIKHLSQRLPDLAYLK